MASPLKGLKLHFFLNCVLVASDSLCTVNLGGIFPLRRSPVGLQRELAARTSFCEFFSGCTTDFRSVIESQSSTNIIPRLEGIHKETGLNVTYYIMSESSPTTNTDTDRVISRIISLFLDFEVSGVIGPTTSGAAVAAHPVAQIFAAPYLSYSATSTDLSNINNYPNFFRVVPPDDSQALAMVSFMQRAGWENIVILNTRDSYGSTGASAVERVALNRRINVLTRQEFFVGETETDIINGILSRVLQLRGRVILLFMIESDAVTVLRQAIKLGMSGSEWTWISSDGFTGTDLASFEIGEVARGFIGFTQASSFKNPQFINWRARWERVYNQPGNLFTNFRNQSISNSYQELEEENLPHAYSEYGSDFNAYAPFAHDAMQLFLSTIVDLGRNGITPCTTTLKEYRSILVDSLISRHINGTTGRVAFNRNQDRSTADYEVLNHDGMNWQRVLVWNTLEGLSLFGNQTSTIAPLWSSGRRGFLNAPLDLEPEMPDEEEDDTDLYFYVILCLLPVLGVLFYFLIKRKGEGWAEILAQVWNETTLVSCDIVINILDFSSDTASFVVVHTNPNYRDLRAAYTVFLVLAGISIFTHLYLAIVTLRSLLCKDSGKFSLAEEIADEKSCKEIYLTSGKMISLRKKAELEFLLNKSYHGVKVSVVALLTVLFEDVPFMVINAVVLVREGEINIIILISFALNCFFCGLAPGVLNDIVTNLETSRKLIKYIAQTRFDSGRPTSGKSFQAMTLDSKHVNAKIDSANVNRASSESVLTARNSTIRTMDSRKALKELYITRNSTQNLILSSDSTLQNVVGKDTPLSSKQRNGGNSDIPRVSIKHRSDGKQEVKGEKAPMPAQATETLNEDRQTLKRKSQIKDKEHIMPDSYSETRKAATLCEEGKSGEGSQPSWSSDNVDTKGSEDVNEGKVTKRRPSLRRASSSLGCIIESAAESSAPTAKGRQIQST